jgi:DNA invertase Pin-like site-specific DNA recombinase
LNILDTVAKAGAQFRSLGDAWADTTTPQGCLIVKVLAGLGEFERALIRSRTGEGRIRAKARGVHMGRPLRRALAPAGWRRGWCLQPRLLRDVRCGSRGPVRG